MTPTGNIEDHRRLLEIISDPAELSIDTLHEISGMVQNFAYFQTAQLLLAANFLKEGQLSQFNGQLKKAAAYALDRKKLKELIESVRALEAQEHIPEPQTKPAPVPVSVTGEEPGPPVVLRDDDLGEQVEDSIVSELEIESITDSVKPATPLLTKEELIERFIQEEPRIASPRASFFNPSTTAIRSMTDDEEIVTETLAILFFKQGNPTKAIKIYEKLSLLFPEKSSYFAAQIKKISSKE